MSSSPSSRSTSTSCVQTIQKLATAATLWFGAKLVMEGELTIGQVVGIVGPSWSGKSTLTVEGGKRIPLTPGMTISAEVRTGTRKPIEYVLAPLQRYKDESGRER